MSTGIQDEGKQAAPPNLTPPLDSNEINRFEHFVQFYETDEFLLNSVSCFVAAGLSAQDVCIVVATEEHRAKLDECLQASGVDTDAAIANGQYISLDASETLSNIMFEGSPDASRFSNVIGGIVADAKRSNRRIRIFGEMVGVLWAEGNYNAAVRLEQLWNDLHKVHDFSLFCAYPMSGSSKGALCGPLGMVCAQHSKVIPAESYTNLTDPDERLRAITILQQKAISLEAQIVERNKTEERLRASENRYRRLFEASLDGILIVDSITRKITDANPAITRLLGVTRDDLLDRELWEVGLFDSPESSIQVLTDLEQKSTTRCDHLRVRSREGQPLDIELISTIYQANGHPVVQCNIRDITERRGAQQVASHLAAIVESSDDAIISKSLEGIILSWNKGAERIFGYTSEEAIGKSVQILIPPDRMHEEPAILGRLKQNQRIDHYETIRTRKDGRLIDVSLTVSPIKDASGRIIAASKIARDISERKRTESEREQLFAMEQAARTEAERANRLKDEFLATVSHELRTPLNAIIGWAHMVRSGMLDEGTARQALETIERNAKSQAQLIEDILDVSRVITGKLRLNIGRVDISSVINAAIDAVLLAANAKNIQLEVRLDPTVRNVSGDATRLQQAVWNLLSNAIKFTPAGGRVDVRLERAGSTVQIAVSDTGQGISPDFLPFIFDRFRQADPTSTRRNGGLGLGLSIVRHLVELHGGTVDAHSGGEGQGAEFTIRLPLTVPNELPKTRTVNTESLKPNEPSVSVNPVPTLGGIRVLLVDDDEDTLNMLSFILEEYMATVETARSVPQALEVMEWYNPDVLVSDLAMPDEDGYSLIAKIRNREAESGRMTQAIALTAFVRVEDRARALSSGFNMFVPKPVEPNELIATIANLTEATRSASV